jgi:hypothetical protein
MPNPVDVLAATKAAIPVLSNGDAMRARFVKPSGSVKQTVSLMGPSGTGKTEQIGRCISAGLKTLVVSTESKLSTIAHLDPDVFVVENLDFPRSGSDIGSIKSDLWDLVQFLRKSDHGYDLVAIDSGMKYAAKLLDYLKYNVRLSGFELYGGFGERMLKMVEKFKELADGTLWPAPTHFVMTFGVEMGQDWKARRAMLPLLDGKMVSPRLPYEFDHVLMLAKKEDAAGVTKYAMYTAGTEEFDAKVSGPVKFDSPILDPNLGEVIKKIAAAQQQAPTGAV